MRSPDVMRVGRMPPSRVQKLPQITALRQSAVPDPTSVAMPFDTSLAPFANATPSTRTTSRRFTVDIGQHLTPRVQLCPRHRQVAWRQAGRAVPEAALTLSAPRLLERGLLAR